jgi:adenylylsulfate kinase
MSALIVLLFGLPGSGKTTLAKDIAHFRKDVISFNADAVRKAANDWDFSMEGRTRQAQRMKMLGEECYAPIALLDFVCPTPELRHIVSPDIMLWMNTIKVSRYEDTNKAWVPPTAGERLRNGFVEIDRYIPHSDVPEFFSTLVGEPYGSKL